jgi:hypothetical protein
LKKLLKKQIRPLVNINSKNMAIKDTFIAELKYEFLLKITQCTGVRMYGPSADER